MNARVAVVYGTRPEVIKTAPVIRALKGRSDIDCVAIDSGQHPDLVDQMGGVGGPADRSLRVFEAGQSPNLLMSRVMARLDQLLNELQFDMVLVQGDTTTAAAGGISAFNHRVPVAHLEAGLRSGSLTAPFPEEGNRRILSQIAALHLATTVQAQGNLLAEGISPRIIRVVGNTVLDALRDVLKRPVIFRDQNLANMSGTASLIVVTAHRRENWGSGMALIGQGVRAAARELPESLFVVPLHPNPRARIPLQRELIGSTNVVLTEPLTYGEFACLLNRADVVVTDSGGVQEEAWALGKPLVILRSETERPEVLIGGRSVLAGVDPRTIHSATLEAMSCLAPGAAADSSNHYGEGRATPRVVDAIVDHLGITGNCSS